MSWDLILAALVVVAALIVLGRSIAIARSRDRKRRPSVKPGPVSGGSGTEKKGPTRPKDRPTV